MTWKYADELEHEYTEDLKPVKARCKELKKRKTFLLAERRLCEQLGKWDEVAEMTCDIGKLNELITKLGSVISSSQYSIDWLHHAKEPGNRREIGRRSRYQRTEYWGDIEQVTFNKFREAPEELSKSELERLDDYLSTLTRREREAIESVIGKGNSYGETAEYMAISKSSVQSYVKRGMRKIDKALRRGVQTSFF